MAVPEGSAMSMIRVLAADDHPIVRDGIARLVGTQADMELIAEASDGAEAVEQFRKHRPDVTLMDLQMPNMSGIDAISAIRNEFPDARIIVLTTYAGDVQVMRALKAGAQGYLLKALLRKELLETIRAVHGGQKRLSAEVAFPGRKACAGQCVNSTGNQRLEADRRRQCQQGDCRAT